MLETGFGGLLREQPGELVPDAEVSGGQDRNDPAVTAVAPHEVAGTVARFEHARFAEPFDRLLHRDLADAELLHDLPDRKELLARIQFLAAVLQAEHQLVGAVEFGVFHR